MDNSFEFAFNKVISTEGGFTSNPKDRGNWTSGSIGVGQLKGTKFGISAMSYPHEDIINLTVDRAKTIYRRDFWDKLQLDNFNTTLAFNIFDAAVQHGCVTAVRFLQRLVNVESDGVIGPKTIAAVLDKNQNELAFSYIAKRINFYTTITTFSQFGKGWMNRMAVNIEITSHLLGESK